MVNAAIMGFGTVGSGVYEIITKNAERIKHNALESEITVSRILDIRDFPDHPAAELFTKDFNDILNDPDITVVAEVMGGLHPAYEFTKQLLEAGKSVVTSNKELVATYGTELMEIAVSNNINYMFEASVGGGIPVIRPLHQCLTANNINRIAGILNGTTNYILNEMIDKGKSFDDALADAQAKGYAERNPAADIEGHDACRKIAILASLACGYYVDCGDIATEGITDITLEDVKYASKLGSVIKLIGYAEFDEDGKLYASVSPRIIDRKNMLAGVDGVMNAIMLTGDCVGDVMFYGAGAGKLPTASAVVADIVDCVRHLKTTKHIQWVKPVCDFRKDPDLVKVSYFIRTDKPLCEIEKYFKATKVIDGVVDGETGVVTEEMADGEARARLAALNVRSAIRLLK